MRRIPVPRVLRIRCLRMETFEKHILNILNRKLQDSAVYGEFFIVKSHKPSTFKFQKKFKVSLYFKNLEKSVVIKETERMITIQESEVSRGYDMLLEDLLYHIIFDENVWNSISFKLR